MTIAIATGIMLGLSGAALGAPAFSTAMGITAAVVFVLLGVAFFSKFDFTSWAPYLIIFALILTGMSIATIFVHSYRLQIVYASLGALFFSIYLLVDMQMILGGKHKRHQFSIDDYAFAALCLYLDIINLFMYILQIIALTREEQ